MFIFSSYGSQLIANLAFIPLPLYLLGLIVFCGQQQMQCNCGFVPTHCFPLTLMCQQVNEWHISLSFKGKKLIIKKMIMISTMHISNNWGICQKRSQILNYIDWNRGGPGLLHAQGKQDTHNRLLTWYKRIPIFNWKHFWKHVTKITDMLI